MRIFGWLENIMIHEIYVNNLYDWSVRNFIQEEIFMIDWFYDWYKK